MWTIIKIDKKKFELFKQDLRRKLGSESKFYAPKIKISSIRSNRKVEKNLFLLGSYIFVTMRNFVKKSNCPIKFSYWTKIRCKQFYFCTK